MEHCWRMIPSAVNKRIPLNSIIASAKFISLFHFLGALSLPLTVCRNFQESRSLQGKAPAFLLRSLKSTRSLLRGRWSQSQCLGSLLPSSCSAQRAERGVLVPSAPCAGQVGRALTLCVSLSLQMARPIQVKPADSESRGGSCHLSLFLVWQLCACEGNQRNRVLSRPPPPHSSYGGTFVCGGDLGGRRRDRGLPKGFCWDAPLVREAGEQV